MKCPACVEGGLKSRLSEHHGPHDEGEVERFYDKEGVRHIHDWTVYRTVFTCSNSHAYQQQYRSPCVCKGCEWNELPLVKAGSAKIGE